MGSCKSTPPEGVLDLQLIQKAETLGCGNSVHRIANYLASYVSLAKLYRESDSSNEAAILCDLRKAEKRLRRLVNES